MQNDKFIRDFDPLIEFMTTFLGCLKSLVVFKFTLVIF